jgi:TolB-like protein
MEIRPLGTDAYLAELLSEVALTEASRVKGLDVVGRSDIGAMIGFERQKLLLGCSEDSACLAEIGGALGVDALLVGTLGRIETLHRIDLRLVDTRRARVLARFGESVEGKAEKLVKLVQLGTRELLEALIPAELPATPPPPAVAAATPPAPQAARATAPTPAARPTAVVPVAEAPVRLESAGSSRRVWGWALAGTGAALGAVGLAFGLQAKAALDAEKKAGAAGDYPTYLAKRDLTRSASRKADLLFAGGAVAAGVGIYLILSGGRTTVAVAPDAGGGHLLLAGSF